MVLYCLKAVYGLLGYAAGAAAELLDGTLKLRYCTRPFGERVFSWSLPSYPPFGFGCVLAASGG